MVFVSREGISCDARTTNKHQHLEAFLTADKGLLRWLLQFDLWPEKALGVIACNGRLACLAHAAVSALQEGGAAANKQPRKKARVEAPSGLTAGDLLALH